MRIRVNKSAVLVHYDMTKVFVSLSLTSTTISFLNHNYFFVLQTFSHKAYEQAIRKSKCRDDWYARDYQLGCRRKYTPEGEKIFDSQVCLGFCLPNFHNYFYIVYFYLYPLGYLLSLLGLRVVKACPP